MQRRRKKEQRGGLVSDAGSRRVLIWWDVPIGREVVQSLRPTEPPGVAPITPLPHPKMIAVSFTLFSNRKYDALQCLLCEVFL